MGNTRQVPEEQLLKALSDMEAIAKGDDGKMPSTTAQANGGLSNEGDKSELSVDAKNGSSKSMDDDAQLSLGQWALGDDDASKGDDMDEDDESMESDEDEDEGEDEEMTKKGKNCAKSATISDLMKSDSELGPVIDAIPVMESFVDQVSESDANLRKSIMTLNDTVTAQNRVIKAMAQVVLQSHKLLKGYGEQPASQRKTVLHKSEISDRFAPQAPQLSKSEVLDVMLNMVQTGDQTLTPIDITRFEVTNTMDPKVRKAVENHILSKSA